MFMTERTLKNIMVGVCVFLTVVIAAYVLYSYIYRRSGQNAVETVTESVPSVNASSYNDNKDNTNAATAESDGYVARINDNALAVYAVNNGREEFLYNLDIRIEDISESEKQRLLNGIRLSDKKALASFEEDFTS